MRMVGPRLDSGRSSSVALLVRLFSLRITCRSRRVSEASLEVTLIVERPMVAMPEDAANNIVAHLSRPGRWFSRRRCRCVINFVVTEKFGIERTPHFSTMAASCISNLLLKRKRPATKIERSAAVLLSSCHCSLYAAYITPARCSNPPPQAESFSIRCRLQL